jgi:hypothetical protein
LSTDVSEVRAASIIRAMMEAALIALMIEAARTSETSVDNYFTWQYIPEDNSDLHTRRRENWLFSLCFKPHDFQPGIPTSFQ